VGQTETDIHALLVLAGVAAFAGMAVAGETVCAADPDFEMTALTIAFQSVGYAVAMAIANVFYGLGSQSSDGLGRKICHFIDV